MPRNFTESDIEKICEFIDAWSGNRITWAAICKACEPILGLVPTRQGLQCYEAIYEAYKLRKDYIHQGINRLPSHEEMTATNLRLKGEAKKLEEQKKAISRALEVLRFKALEVLNMKGKQLFMPMAKVDRSILRHRSQSFGNGN
ncbi:MAG: hypothetical protein HRT88_00055 [Lentisphaeraceae bacterium]|nr:hypothetical protein [Lentisphaeraceae bacterium]